MAAKYIISILSFAIVINGKQEGFIVGGQKASNIKDFAYCAALFINADIRCGSSILNQLFLITAAHCLEGASQITANVGSLDRDDGIKRNVVKYIKHGHYSDTTLHNDIGLCKVNPPLELTQVVKRVVLLKKLPAFEEGDVAGWGVINEYKNTDTQRLKHTKQKVWSYQQCKNVLKHILPQGTICGGDRLSKRDFAAAGDSGGPLVVHNHIQLGLVSFKIPDISASLVIYTDLSYFYDWIENTARKLACHSS